MGRHLWPSSSAFAYNKRLHLTTASVTPCADAQAAPATLAGEADVRKSWNESTMRNLSYVLAAILACVPLEAGACEASWADSPIDPVAIVVGHLADVSPASFEQPGIHPSRDRRSQQVGGSVQLWFGCRRLCLVGREPVSRIPGLLGIRKPACPGDRGPLDLAFRCQASPRGGPSDLGHSAGSQGPRRFGRPLQ